MNELPIRYNPKETEDKWYKAWEDGNLFAGKPDPAKKPFCIVIPPPNVTGILHMGHALNNTIQDILIRYHRMKGQESLWMPGTDHAGIATQNVVEKALAKEGLKRQDLGREKFIERVWQWKEQYGSTIIRQLKKMGASCDWPRTRFTMDDDYSRAVKVVFVKLWDKGLIYQDSKVINWCPRCQTALSDEEAPHHDLQGNLYYIKYSLKDDPDEFVTVATTRPETMLGDTAVAVNPKDKRYKKLVGKTLILPLVNRQIKIIADSMVDTKFGTGAVKVTPAHDPNDYLLGKKHKLEFINVMSADGRMNENAGDYKDMDRFEAREVILEDLKEKGLLEKTEPHPLSAGHCYRCHTIIEPYLSRQWFVKMQPLARPAIAAVKKGKIKFHPARWTKVYLNWMENIQDWCISRQIWWGHRIPIWYCLDCKKLALASVDDPKECPQCKSQNIRQDDNVLDTWFSSWLWPFATFKEKSDLEYFYPTSVLVTAPEIIFFWVARMVMAGYEFMGDKPFSDVYIHGTVRDIEGKKMSKSLGNVIDPLDIINEYGADALRFSLISITAQGQDVFLSKERFEQGRNFANKIWNASRFILMNLEPGYAKTDLCVFFKKEDLDATNRWILSRFYSVLRDLDKYLAAYKFNEAANLLYSFFWHEFCDWYLEMIKGDIKNPHNQVVMYKVLEKFLRVLHPFMPFITEEIWQKVQNGDQATSVMIQSWPRIQEQIIDKKAEADMQAIFDLITNIRNLKALIGVDLKDDARAELYSYHKTIGELARQNHALIERLSGLKALSFKDRDSQWQSSILITDKHFKVSLRFGGSFDAAKIKDKMQSEIQRLTRGIEDKDKRLKNRDFVKRAPAEIVAKETQARDTAVEQLKRLKDIFNGIQ